MFFFSILFPSSVSLWFLYVMAAYPMNVSNYVFLLKVIYKTSRVARLVKLQDMGV